MAREPGQAGRREICFSHDGGVPELKATAFSSLFGFIRDGWKGL